MEDSCIVYWKGMCAGILQRSRHEYRFIYAANFLGSPFAEAISHSLPLRSQQFVSQELFPCFDQLLPKGKALLAFAKLEHCNPRNPIEVLARLGKRTVGAVSFGPPATDSGLGGDGTTGPHFAR